MEIIEYSEKYKYQTFEVFKNTIASVNSKDYNEEQIRAWIDLDRDMDQWHRSLLENYSILVVENGQLLGFGDMNSSGYLNRLYVHKDYQGLGIASLICQELERKISASTYTTEASISAKNFFLSKGFILIKKQEVVKNNVNFFNYLMKKNIN